eukprot:CAMPEP_0117619192 /NCGR_PEP_ID=MMETSP0784-20121206/86491_1 /TAXON_ID=39447 /ORGANISM="" /LENGTH=89 /DNA_ID=CAMNT_0005423077 /DNA_START=172 /DNA_END=441 /DNA_ORIENTATION=-
MNEKWTISIPGATCYTVMMDPHSWTPNKNDYVKIFGVTNGVPTQYKNRLFKSRLSEFQDTDITAESLEIEFISDSYGTSWGFKAYFKEC